MILHRPVQIGSFVTSGNLFLAPVAGYSDAAYRSICHDAGCDLAFTEMVSSEALARGNIKTHMLLGREKNEKDYAVQLFGSNPDTLAKAAAMVEERWQPAIIDLNCGCPVPKIIKTGAGSALMLEPQKIRAIVKAMTDLLSVPVTVKIRLGWDASSINYLDAARAAMDGGAKAISLHARTRAQGYSGNADKEAFFVLAASVPLPVFASGDIFSPETALNLLKEDRNGKKLAGVMFARGAMGDPFIFSRTLMLLNNKKEEKASTADIIKLATKHLDLSIAWHGEKIACMEFRKHACSYLKGQHEAAVLRKMAVSCSSRKDYEKFFLAWKQNSAKTPG
ncbi:tRNA dihydrouridine synthase DusB [Spirochaetota bacterium]